MGMNASFAVLRKQTANLHSANDSASTSASRLDFCSLVSLASYSLPHTGYRLRPAGHSLYLRQPPRLLLSRLSCFVLSTVYRIPATDYGPQGTASPSQLFFSKGGRSDPCVVCSV